MPNEIQSLIQFTFVGKYTEDTVNAYALFLGYQEELDMLDGKKPNPQTKVEFIQSYIKGLLVNELSRLRIEMEQKRLKEEMESAIIQLSSVVMEQVSSDIEVTASIV